MTSELSFLSGNSAPFGGASIADRIGWSYYRNLGKPMPKKEEPMPERKRRSTADEAKARNAKDRLIASNFKSGDRTFKVCCLKAGVEPTKRQAAKFKRGEGAAFAALPTLTDDDYNMV